MKINESNWKLFKQESLSLDFLSAFKDLAMATFGFANYCFLSCPTEQLVLLWVGKGEEERSRLYWRNSGSWKWPWYQITCSLLLPILLTWWSVQMAARMMLVQKLQISFRSLKHMSETEYLSQLNIDNTTLIYILIQSSCINLHAHSDLNLQPEKLGMGVLCF